MKIAVCQFTAGPDVDANAKTCTELIGAAAAAGAELAVLPEASMYFDPTGPRTPHGQALDGSFVTAIAEAAAANHVTAVVGMSELLPGENRDSNTLVALADNGETIGVYRKIHLYDAFGFRESDTVKPADITAPLVFPLGGLTVGALTCYDLRFPEAFRWVVDAGADLLVLPAAWAVGPNKEDHWITLLRARAIENTVYLAAAGQTAPASCGHSVVVDPMGIVVAGIGEQPGIAVATVDPERITQARAMNPSLANRRFAVIPR